jgi:hypothetical protein
MIWKCEAASTAAVKAAVLTNTQESEVLGVASESLVIAESTVGEPPSAGLDRRHLSRIPCQQMIDQNVSWRVVMG